ncbi:hypothetical protein Ccrd_025531 [Cynara cardunculus var. scolymus]|uniref:Myb/SANT-like DNA-binding domain-containing protein n=1 Tax=Cynara cardunculus var. scolymus TaxID=59895 RepID=A0A103XDM0_CYNCS|nr:hypothetical protein Ccrd_025531 [Cynara cardunculus var. scolymus]
MDKPNKQENPSLLTNRDHDSPPKKPPPATVAGGGGDRLKRDEWSEGAVSSLLEAYEAKWVLRNRAKLKGHDWEDVAKHVSSRANSSKSPKTQTQCKNKIESMKKRYRSESATTDVSSWPLYPRLDLLLRGSAGPPLVTVAASAGDLPCSSIPIASSNLPLMVFEHTPPPPPPPLPSTLIHSSSTPVTAAAPAPGSNPEDVEGTKIPDHQLSEKMEIETDCSTPALYSNKEKIQSKNHKTRMTDGRKRRRKSENWDVAESIRWLAKVMVRSEQAKAETMRELEKMRADAEVKRGEIDLKRTEIIAHTQLEIARLLAASLGKGVDPSLRIGRS